MRELPPRPEDNPELDAWRAAGNPSKYMPEGMMGHAYFSPLPIGLGMFLGGVVAAQVVGNVATAAVNYIVANETFIYSLSTVITFALAVFLGAIGGLIWIIEMPELQDRKAAKRYERWWSKNRTGLPQPPKWK